MTINVTEGRLEVPWSFRLQKWALLDLLQCKEQGAILEAVYYVASYGGLKWMGRGVKFMNQVGLVLTNMALSLTDWEDYARQMLGCFIVRVATCIIIVS